MCKRKSTLNKRVSEKNVQKIERVWNYLLILINKFMRTFKYILSIIVIISVVYSCKKNNSEEILDNKSELIYNRDNVSVTENYPHYRTIQSIEKITNNNYDFKQVINKVPNLKTSSSEVFKYTYDGDIISYKVGDVYIYKHKDNILPIRVIETTDSNNIKTLTISNIINDELYYVMALDMNNSKILHFGKVNNFPLEKLGFSENSTSILKSAAVQDVECTDYGWADCMDCSVEDCGRHWWCVGLLVVAGGETLVGMAVACAVL